MYYHPRLRDRTRIRQSHAEVGSSQLQRNRCPTSRPPTRSAALCLPSTTHSIRRHQHRIRPTPKPVVNIPKGGKAYAPTTTGTKTGSTYQSTCTQTASLPTLNGYDVLENLHIPTRQHLISTITIALLVSLVVQVLFHYSPRIAAKARTWRAARAARKAKHADASSPHADTSSFTELHAPSAPRLQHIQQPLSLPPVENILQLSPADRLAIICATAQPTSARQPPPPAYSSRTTRH